jgi:hypothetical protein
MRLRFLVGPTLWEHVTNRIREAGHVTAAIAYVGQGGSRLLPLKRHDVLLVDMSLRAVGQGVTDPSEIRKLIERDVRVYTRSSLHAKLFVVDKHVVIGSANASRNSATYLDEAAIESDDVNLRRVALRYIEGMCTEPVRKEYLKKCIAAYRPPVFKAAADAGAGKTTRQRPPPKLWIMGGLQYLDIPNAERERAKAAEKRATRLLRSASRTFVDQYHFPREPNIAKQLGVGDWVIACVRDSDGEVDVWPPQQFLSTENYPRGKGKRRWLLHFEAPTDGEPLSRREFALHARRILKIPTENAIRTRPVHDVQEADEFLRLWTDSGRRSRRSQ